MTVLLILVTQFLYFLNITDMLMKLMHQYDGATTFMCQEDSVSGCVM